MNIKAAHYFPKFASFKRVKYMWQSKDFQDVLDCDMRSLIAHWHFL